MGGECKHDFGDEGPGSTERCRHCGASGFTVAGFIDEEKLQADKAAEEISEKYAQGGYIGPGRAIFRNDTGVPILIHRGELRISAASLAALGPDMLERLFPDTDIGTAEDALAELEDDE